MCCRHRRREEKGQTGCYLSLKYSTERAMAEESVKFGIYSPKDVLQEEIAAVIPSAVGRTLGLREPTATPTHGWMSCSTSNARKVITRSPTAARVCILWSPDNALGFGLRHRKRYMESPVLVTRVFHPKWLVSPSTLEIVCTCMCLFWTCSWSSDVEQCLPFMIDIRNARAPEWCPRVLLDPMIISKDKDADHNFSTDSITANGYYKMHLYRNLG